MPHCCRAHASASPAPRDSWPRGSSASSSSAGCTYGPARRAAVPHLESLPGAAERLELVEADLLQPSSFDAAVQGCTTVFHTASPYVIQVADPQRDLVDPAVNGTLAVLEACAKAAQVTRVVLTSSMAAVTDEPDDSRVLTEADWNEKSTLRRNPYYLSKTLAERAAWSFVEHERPAFNLVAMNPFVIMGPSLGPGLNVSNKIVADIVNGVYPGILSLPGASSTCATSPTPTCAAPTYRGRTAAICWRRRR